MYSARSSALAIDFTSVYLAIAFCCSSRNLPSSLLGIFARVDRPAVHSRDLISSEPGTLEHVVIDDRLPARGVDGGPAGIRVDEIHVGAALGRHP